MKPTNRAGARRELNRVRRGRAIVVATVGSLTLLAVMTFAGSAPLASATNPTPTWTQLSPATSPPLRFSSAVAFDRSTDQLVLFGGATGSGAKLNHTWTWSGITWTQISPTTSPPGRFGASMAYDNATGQLVLFGGYNGTDLNDTWIWNGTTWSEMQPTTSPPARVYASMAYDSATGQLVLFGGQGTSSDGNSILLNDTWTWNGTTWTAQSPATSPPARESASMAYDSATGQLVLFGGVADFNDTWIWNGTTWSEMEPTTKPQARFGASMAYDSATGQLVLFGGDGVFGLLNDTRNWNGTAWHELSPPASPTERLDAAMAYDPSTGHLVLFGGSSGQGPLNDTWEYGAVPVPPSTTTTPSVEPTSTTHGEDVLYGASVTSASGTPTGNVQFSVGSTKLCFATLSAGAASCSAANAPIGADNVTATYLGSDIYQPSSGSTPLEVSRAPTTTTASVQPTSTTHGDAVLYGSTVTSASGTPNGYVQFSIGSTKLCFATLSAGVASCSAANAPVGSDTVTATYLGAAIYLGSSGTTTLDVNTTLDVK